MPNPIDLTTIDAVRGKLQLGQGGQPITSVQLLSGGAGYPDSFSVLVAPADGNGSGAQLNGVAVGGVVQYLTLTQTNKPAVGSGSGYTATPNLIFPSGGTGAGAIAYLGEDVEIQRCITEFSAEVMRMTGRGPADGTIPVTWQDFLNYQVQYGKPFATPFAGRMQFDERADGSGTERQFFCNWPIRSVVSLTINGKDMKPSTDDRTAGYVIDASAKSIAIRGYGGGWGSCGAPLGFSAAYARIGSVFSFVRGIQNIRLVYVAGFDAVPYDLEEKVRLVVVQTLRRRSTIDQASQGMAGEVASFRSWDIPPDAVRVIRYYRAYNSF